MQSTLPSVKRPKRYVSLNLSYDLLLCNVFSMQDISQNIGTVHNEYPSYYNYIVIVHVHVHVHASIHVQCTCSHSIIIIIVLCLTRPEV